MCHCSTRASCLPTPDGTRTHALALNCETHQTWHLSAKFGDYERTRQHDFGLELCARFMRNHVARKP
eukprot:5657215-Pleurochrysis_carterae.AAC.1